MSFFYDLNKKLDGIRATPEVTHKQLNERAMSRAAKGIEKYTQPGMEELSRLGREGASKEKMDAARKKYDQYDNTEVDEGAHSQDAMALNPDFNKIGRKPGVMDRVAQGAKKVADVLAPGDDELLDRLQKSSGAAMRQPRQPGAKEPRYMEAMSPAKQKSFAALAPPKDKITFADKIAGAKKEVDEMLGDVAAEAMKKALGGGRGRDQEMEEASTGNAFDYKNFKQPEKQKATSFVHKGTYGTEYDGDKDDAKALAAKKKAAVAAGQATRGRGRPKRNADSDTGQVMKPDFGAFGVTGKDIKLPKHKGAVTKHKMVGEDDLDPKDPGEYDQEGDMAKDSIKTVVRHAQALEKILGDNDNLPEWVQSKLAKIESMMTAVDDYMQNQETDQDDEKMQEASFPVPPGYPAFKKKKPAPSVPPTKDNKDDEEKPIAEKAVSKKQQRFMGMVSAAKKGEKPASKEVAKVAKTMKKSDAEDFASTKHKGLPEKAAKKNKEEDVEESTTSGSVATSG
jgi:hypothetical protein